MGLQPAKAPEAFAKVEPLLGALADEAVLREADVGPAVNVALSVVAKLRGMGEVFAKDLPQYTSEAIDALEDAAHAAWFADVLASRGTGTEAASALFDEARTLREGLIVAADALAFRGLFDKDAVAALRRAPSDIELVKDVVTLASMFAAEWPRVGMKTAVERKEVDRAVALGAELVLALAATQAGKEWANDPAEARARAYTLLVQRYDGARRAVSYVRWSEADADTIAPPLAKKRAGRKSKDGAQDAATENGVTEHRTMENGALENGALENGAAMPDEAASPAH